MRIKITIPNTSTTSRILYPNIQEYKKKRSRVLSGAEPGGMCLPVGPRSANGFVPPIGRGVTSGTSTRGRRRQQDRTVAGRQRGTLAVKILRGVLDLENPNHNFWGKKNGREKWESWIFSSETGEGERFWGRKCSRTWTWTQELDSMSDNGIILHIDPFIVGFMRYYYKSYLSFHLVLIKHYYLM